MNKKQIVVIGLKDRVILVVVFSTRITRMIAMNSIILFVTAIGVSLTIVLLFGATVLSINRWKYGITGRHSRNKENENKHSQRIRDLEARSVIRSKPRTKKIKQLSNWNELVNKKSQHL